MIPLGPRLLRRLSALIVLLVGLMHPPASRTPAPATPRSVAPALDEVDARHGSLRAGGGPPVRRRGAVRARTLGGGGNAYSRGRIDVAWKDGQAVRFGADFLLPRGFRDRMQGQVDLLRWDDYPTVRHRTHRAGVVLFRGDRRAHLVRQRLGVEEVAITGPFDLPEGRWFHLEVRQRLGAGSRARNEVWVDGRPVARSDRPNTYGNGVDRVRFGLVAVDAERQRRPLTLWFARPHAGRAP